MYTQREKLIRNYTHLFALQDLYTLVRAVAVRLDDLLVGGACCELRLTRLATGI